MQNVCSKYEKVPNSCLATVERKGYYTVRGQYILGIGWFLMMKQIGLIFLQGVIMQLFL